ncbi:hypothetical protein NW759_010084 [Fusarium solani]|nr:hypothetical protein NW759_010084 [Fusarium solani]
MAKLEPATDIDPNVWYHMTEENVDDYDGDFKSMLQTWEDGDFRVFPVAKRKTYWQFQPIGKIPGRYALRCSETTTQKQFAVCYRPSESVENRRTRACLRNSDGSDGQQWDVALWGKNDTYRFINVHNGSKYHLDVIPSGPVYMSPNLDGYQRRQRWLMTSVSNVDDAAYSTVFSNAPESSADSATTTGESGNQTGQPDTDSGGSDNSSLSGGAIAGIVIGAVLGVLAIALVAFFLWRRRKRQAEGAPASTQAPPYPQSPDGYKPETSSPTPVYELPNNQNPAELPANH